MSRPTRCAQTSLQRPARCIPWADRRRILRLGLVLLLGLASSLATAFATPPPPGVGSNPPRESGQTQTQPPAQPTGTAAAITTSPQASEPGGMSKDEEGSGVTATIREEVLSLAILFFGLVVLVVQYLLLKSPKRNSYEILQLLAINLIVTGTLFLISAGYGAEQIAPGLGLFGTVAGYVLGRRSGDPPPADRSDANASGSR